MGALILSLALACPQGADAAEDTRTLWVYEGGWFGQQKDGFWYEYNEMTIRKLGKPSKFKEVKRTKEFVELLDEGRKVGIRLGEDGVEVLDPGSDEWKPLYKGRWVKPKE
ncbi:MAG: hypothetical protein K2V38_12315 [Gemmataceae bacterium]|nr:hypothetical protein [Gemmataceae bacterium]